MTFSILVVFLVRFFTLFIMRDTRGAPSFPTPTCRAEVRMFLGLVSFCRPLINDFAATVAPLTLLLRPNVPFIWTDAQENAFCDLKSQLTVLMMT